MLLRTHTTLQKPCLQDLDSAFPSLPLALGRAVGMSLRLTAITVRRFCSWHVYTLPISGFLLIALVSRRSGWQQRENML